jgi:hypothetical protein
MRWVLKAAAAVSVVGWVLFGFTDAPAWIVAPCLLPFPFLSILAGRRQRREQGKPLFSKNPADYY